MSAIALALAACEPANDEPVSMTLPGAFNTDFPGNDIPFSNIELNRLSALTRHAFEQYFTQAPDYSEYSAQLRADTSLKEQASSLRAALGDGWEPEEYIGKPNSSEVLSFLDSGRNARIVIIAVPGEREDSEFQPIRILSSIPIAELP